MNRAWSVCSFVLLTSCSLATSWDGLPIGVSPDASVDANESADAEADAALDSGCGSGALYCGGDGVVGDPSTLYRCGASGMMSAIVTCSKGCVRREPKANDECICIVGGFYCGDDQVVGDPKTLYKCASDYSATFVQTCPNQCVVNTGNDDSCK